MAFTNAIFHPMLDAAASEAVEASLHTGSPGSDGSNNEVDGGDYERQSISWDDPSGGSLQADDELVFAVPELSDDASHVGLWNSNGDYLGPAVLSTPQPFPTPGTLTVEPLTLSMSS